MLHEERDGRQNDHRPSKVRRIRPTPSRRSPPVSAQGPDRGSSGVRRIPAGARGPVPDPLPPPTLAASDATTPARSDRRGAARVAPRGLRARLAPPRRHRRIGRRRRGAAALDGARDRDRRRTASGTRDRDRRRRGHRAHRRLAGAGRRSDRRLRGDPRPRRRRAWTGRLDACDHARRLPPPLHGDLPTRSRRAARAALGGHRLHRRHRRRDRAAATPRPPRDPHRCCSGRAHSAPRRVVGWATSRTSPA